ncbi:MAG: hypothetical protein Q4A74_08715 [Cardiobacteriaceae bacterium]|nr:hypothetical protein [Cardiobacteriaceae bacterium]
MQLTQEEIKNIEFKKRAITAGLVVTLDPHEADCLGITSLDEVSDDEEKDLLDSRFDPSEYSDNYELK